MIASPRNTTPLTLLPVAVALNALAIALTDDLGDAAFLALLASDLIVVVAIALLGMAQKAETVTRDVDAERDRRTLDALEPLRAEGPAGEGR